MDISLLREAALLGDSMSNQPLYRFAAISDIHIDLENGGKNTYFIHAEENFRHALEIIKLHQCDFIISAGDQVTNASGAEEEWRRYRQIIDDSGYDGLILEAMGNHETRSAKYGLNSLGDCRRDFIRYTKLGEKPLARQPGKTYYAYTEPSSGDLFLFLSLENGVSTNEIDNFSDDQMDWVEQQLKTGDQDDRRVFLIQHANLYGSGVGDDKNRPAYAGALRTHDKNDQPFVNNLRFYHLLCNHPETIWMSGHTHVDLRDRLNYTDHPCHTLHIPALSGSTRIVSDHGGGHILDRTFTGDNAQGYIVDVFYDRVIFKGIDFLSDTYYSDFTYTVESRSGLQQP